MIKIARVALAAFLLFSSFNRLLADFGSAHLDRLERKMGAFRIDPAVGEKIIPVVSFQNAPFQGFVDLMESRGVEVLASSSFADSRVNISLRNLSVNRVMDFVIRQQGGHWMVKNGKVIVFRSPDELNAAFRNDFEKMLEVEQEIREERAKLSGRKTGDLEAVFAGTIIAAFTVEQASAKDILKQLSRLTSEMELGDEGKGFNIIPLFNPKDYDGIRSYTFENQPLLDILNTICEDYGLNWKSSSQNGVITVQPARD